MTAEANKAQLEKLESNEEVLLAETVFQVAHYNEEYESAASTADVSFELTETDEKVHRAIIDAWKQGYETAETALGIAEEEGFVEKEESGGWIVTDAGLEYLQEHADDLGNTYESKHDAGEVPANQNQAETEGDDMEVDIDEDVEEPTEDEIEEEMEIEEVDSEPEEPDEESVNINIDEEPIEDNDES